MPLYLIFMLVKVAEKLLTHIVLTLSGSAAEVSQLIKASSPRFLSRPSASFFQNGTKGLCIDT